MKKDCLAKKLWSRWNKIGRMSVVLVLMSVVFIPPSVPDGQTLKGRLS